MKGGDFSSITSTNDFRIAESRVSERRNRQERQERETQRREQQDAQQRRRYDAERAEQRDREDRLEEPGSLYAFKLQMLEDIAELQVAAGDLRKEIEALKKDSHPPIVNVVKAEDLEEVLKELRGRLDKLEKKKQQCLIEPCCALPNGHQNDCMITGAA